MELRGSRLRLGLPGPAGEQGGWRCTQSPILRGASLLLRGPRCDPGPAGPTRGWALPAGVGCGREAVAVRVCPSQMGPASD